MENCTLLLNGKLTCGQDVAGVIEVVVGAEDMRNGNGFVCTATGFRDEGVTVHGCLPKTSIGGQNSQV